MKRFLYFLLAPVFLLAASCGLFGGGGGGGSTPTVSSTDTAVIAKTGGTSVSFTEASDTTSPIFSQAYDPYICADVISSTKTVIRVTEEYQGVDLGNQDDWDITFQITLSGNSTGTYQGSDAVIILHQLDTNNGYDNNSWRSLLSSQCSGGSPTSSVTVTKVGNVNDTVEGTWTATMYSNGNFDGTGTCQGSAKSFSGSFKATRVSGNCDLF